MTYKISWEDQTILNTWTGNATGDELFAFVKEVHSNPNFDQLRYSLHDFSACTGAVFSQESIELISALDAAAALTNSHIKIGVVAERDDLKAMVKKYMDTGMSPYPVQSFTTVKEMRDWEAEDWAKQ